MEAENKVKRYLIVSFGDAILFAGLLVVGVWLVSLSSQIHWLLALIVAMLFIVILGVVLWFSYKFLMLYRNYKYINKKYTIAKIDTRVDSVDDRYLETRLDEKQYEKIKGTRNNMLYYLYRNKDASSFLPNILLTRFDTTNDVIEKDNTMEQILQINNVPVPDNKTLIIAIISKSNEEIEQVIQLNNPRNILRNKFYCTFSNDTKILSFGAYSELFALESYNQMQSFIYKLFNVRETINDQNQK